MPGPPTSPSSATSPTPDPLRLHPAPTFLRHGHGGRCRVRSSDATLAPAAGHKPNHGPQAQRERDVAWLKHEAYRTDILRENGQEIELPASLAVLLALGVSAINGSRLAARNFMNRIGKSEHEHQQRLIERYARYVRLKRDGLKLVTSHPSRRLEPPELLPHLDYIVLDAAAGESWGPRDA